MSNIVNHNFSIKQEDRIRLLDQKPLVIWFTGLSGSGKSTIANELEILLNKKKFLTYTLDGDNIRSGLNNNLGFSDIDRKENIRRISEVSRLFLDSGQIVLCTFISPFEEDREQAKKLIGRENFFEVYVSTDIEECKTRDPKGLYKKALNGEIPKFTDIDSPYEIPKNFDLEIDTSMITAKEAAFVILQEIKGRIK